MRHLREREGARPRLDGETEPEADVADFWLLDSRDQER
jgi:hypothetical protein